MVDKKSSRRVGFDEVFGDEVAKLKLRQEVAQPYRAGGGKSIKPDSSSTGLALSGGGIRSAAFSLGAVQAMEAEGCFKAVDFLSTVSGGGYTGAALIAGLRKQGGKFPFKTNDGDPSNAADIADNDAVRSIRDHSRYLMPRGRFDLVISLAIILRGLVVNAVLVGCVLFALSALTLILFPNEASLERSGLIALVGHASPSAAHFVQSWLGDWFVATKAMALVFAIWLIGWAIFRSFAVTADKASDTLLSDPGSWAAIGSGHFLVILGIIALIELQQPILIAALRWFGTPEAQAGSYSHIKAFVTALAAGTGLVGLFWRFIIQSIQSAEKDSSWSALLQVVFSRAVLLIAAALLPALIYTAYLVLTVGGLERSGEPPRMGALMAVVPEGGFRGLAVVIPVLSIATYIALSSTWGRMGDTVLDRSWWNAKTFGSPSFITGTIILILAVVAGVVFAMYFAEPLTIAVPLTSPSWIYLDMACVLGLVAILFTENANSLHRLYRDRLQDAFAITDGDNRLTLSGLGLPVNGETARPHPIINATVNIQASDKNLRGRNADFFVFTPHWVGSEATGFARTEEFEKAEPHMDLATAVAVSGAAISSSMGRAGMALLTPTLALLNLRLGLWVRNPRYAETEAERVASNKGDINIGYMVREIFGRLTADSRKVYITDGGHIDNLGLRQLLRRRCDVIIVVDAEQDPALTFGAFVDVARFARIDLGVRFDLPLTDITEAASKRKAAMAKDPAGRAVSPSTSHAAIGTIKYPGKANVREPKEGVILYLKASVTGDEQDYVLDYERRFSKFPHEPTSDQFFGEEQFEAYRALGFHAMSGALTYSDGTERWTKLLTRLRRRLNVQV